MTVVTRFAPSPTGHLHIGGGRTAIFCWLLARHFNGKFLLRVEDTDLERSRQEYTDSILASMNWLGLHCDGKPFFQSERMDFYRETVLGMKEGGHAYWCACPPEEVEAMREEARAQGKKPKYNGKCRDVGLGPGPGRAVRLKAPLEGQVVVDDLVKGPIAFAAEELDDMVLLRADGTPTYNMAVVADDIAMGVTYVLRGDDHVNNTPKQILIYQALGAPLPKFGHVPMILGPDKQKLSKRHGAKAIIDYEKDGLLPEAVINYLVRLGWSCGDQELFSIDELIAAFDGSNMSRAAACFDPEKLLWVNACHLRAMPLAELAERTRPFLAPYGLEHVPQDTLERALALYQPRAGTLADLAREARCLLVDAANLEYAEDAGMRAAGAAGLPHLAGLSAALAVCLFEKDPLRECLRAYVADNGIAFKAIGPVMRFSLLGAPGGPDLADVLAVLGKDETLARMDRAAVVLSSA